jgi:Ca2+-binding RTX toxin-like protein
MNAVTVELEADPNFIVQDGSELETKFSLGDHQSNTLQGPLVLEGGAGDRDRSLKLAITLPHENSAPPKDAVIDDTDETLQTDTLTVFNDGSTADDIGVLSATNISGLDMGTTDLTIPGTDGAPDTLVKAGINYNAMEIIEVLLGSGNDTFTVESTAVDAITAVHGGGNSFLDNGEIGGDHIIVNGGGGAAAPLIIFGDTSQDGSRYSSDAKSANGNAVEFVRSGDDLIDARNSNAGVTIFGGAGADTIYGSQAGDHIAGGSGADKIFGQAGEDHIYGDSGINVDLSQRLSLTEQVISMIVTANPSTDSHNADALAPGADEIHGGLDDDILFGDHGLIVLPADVLRLTTTSSNTVQRIETQVEDTGAADDLYGDGGDDIVMGGNGGDTIRGGANADILFGDHGVVYYMLDSDPSTLDRVETRNVVDGGSDTIYGNAGDDLAFGGVGADQVYGGNSESGDAIAVSDMDVLFGDHGYAMYSSNRLTRFETQDTEFGSSDTMEGNEDNDIILGGQDSDTISGGDGNDLVFGDYGLVEAGQNSSIDATSMPGPNNPFTFTAVQIGQFAADGQTLIGDGDTIDGDAGNDIIIGQQGADTIRGGTGDDDIIGGHNVADGYDTGDFLDGGAGNDVIAGDNASILRRTDLRDERHRELTGSEIYGEGFDSTTGLSIDGMPLVDSTGQQVPGGQVPRDIEIFNHSDVESADNFGADRIAGGADDDVIFGQLGDDFLQGDGSIEIIVDARRNADGFLQITPSVENASDGDDYIEGNGGSDVIFGNLGQDDLIGGSSNLFAGLDGAESNRPDGEDRIFGGAGTDIARNYAGDSAENGHARDADTIAGDNANILRLVEGNQYLSFNYDKLDPARVLAETTGLDFSDQWIVPRAVELLDYTEGGEDYDAAAINDNGAGDELHGESGDDTIYGMTGSDLLFGDGQDDDLIGGHGNDWISGGTGSDGVLGDDGRIYTSRNTQAAFDGQMAEPLYGIAALAETNVEISTPGNAQQAIINVAGELKKTVNLTPFNVDSLEDNLFDAQYADDIIFGGLGDDFLHGGSGDDAISGAEALARSAVTVYPGGSTQSDRADGVVVMTGFDNPRNPGNALGYNALRGGEFAAYNEFEPRVRITVDGDEYVLNFSSTEGEQVAPGIFSDGDDVIFGDLGNDWLVGGTGRDNLYGGRGDDLLNADDDLGTNNDLNDITDTADSYADRAFGGAGRDVLIANTGADRLIDWAGEFNTYLVPFGPFGAPTISRALPPSLFEFLYELSESDGADPTRGIDEGAGADDPRNGEPFGELGLVTQKDFDWQAQTGAPADVQPGNIPGGDRDVVQVATFNQGTAEGFLPDVGTWSVEGSRLQVEPEVLGGDAVSVYYVNDILPSYFELQAVIQGGKPTAGFKSNSYLVFDYQSPTDFKFAGVNISTDKLEIGHRDENGWHVDVQSPSQLRPDRDYNLLLAVNGTTVTLLVNNQDFMTHTFDARVDADGFSYGLNAGLVGLGANNSKARIDNVKVQVLPRDVMPVRQSDFDVDSGGFLDLESSGTWSVSNGYLVGDASTGGLATAWGGMIATTSSDVRVAPGQVLEIETTMEQGATGGVVFDQYGESDFKFVYIDAQGVVSIGHQSGDSWDIDASAPMPGQVKGDYDIKVSLVGSTVNVLVDNQTVVSFVYNALTGDGAVGLLAAGSNVRFDNVLISTNDPAYLDAVTGDALRVSGEAAEISGEVLQPGADLQPMLDAAVARWEAELGHALPGMESLQIWVTDLGDDLLGLTVGDVIFVDSDAAGHGWFIDGSPLSDREFDASGQAYSGSPAENSIDLLSVIAHEVGHVLGHEHATEGDGIIEAGQRKAPDADLLGPRGPGRAGGASLQLMSDLSFADLHHRNVDLVNGFIAGQQDHRNRIVPVNLGMFGEVRTQVPWLFNNTSDADLSRMHAMIWDEEAGNFETAKGLQRAAVAVTSDGDDVLEFLEEVGHWVREKR